MTKRTTGFAVTLILLAVFAFGTQRNSSITPKDSPFSEERAGLHLQTIVGFGPRPAGSDAISKTRNYILSELQKTGLKPELDEFDARTPRGVKHMVNIRARRPGAKRSAI